MTNVVIVDAELGNIGSVKSAIERLNVNYQVAKKPEDIAKGGETTHVILPGVGTFETGMAALKGKNWDKWILENSTSTKILGICLGMQVLANYGYEGRGNTLKEPIEGLGLISGKVKKLETKNKEMRLPHIGWNDIKWTKTKHIIGNEIPNNSDFYFVHSYHFTEVKEENLIATTAYNLDIAAIVASGNIIGVQFHPEKSQKIGNKLLKNFIEN